MISKKKKNSVVGMRFSTERELREFMGSAVPQGQEYCDFCGRLKRKGKPCSCKFGGVFG
jgi:hypothetical protein